MVRVARPLQPSATGTQTLDWSSEGKLTQLTESGQSTTFVYDADGNRLLRRDPGRTTLFLPGQQIQRAGGANTAIRLYAFAGRTVASRTSGALSWVFADRQGTQQLAIDAASQAVILRRQDPYGNPRGTQPAWPNPSGFAGGDRDPTGLTHLGAREYDTLLGRFVSTDPIIDLSDPQQWSPYAYSNNNPITFSDPSGLIPDSGGGSGGRKKWTPLTMSGLTVVDKNGVPHVIRPTADGASAHEVSVGNYLNDDLRARGEYFDGTNGSVYHLQDDNASSALYPKQTFANGDVSGTTADYIKVTYVNGQIVSVESYDLTTSNNRTGFNLQNTTTTIDNKLNQQAQFVIFDTNDDAAARAVEANQNPNVRVINRQSGFDTGEINTPGRTQMLQAKAQADADGGGRGRGGRGSGGRGGMGRLGGALAALGPIGDILLVVDVATSSGEERQSMYCSLVPDDPYFCYSSPGIA